MPTEVDVNEAKAQLSRLIDRAATGEEIVIARSGRPVARLIALEPTGLQRVPGRLRNKIHFSEAVERRRAG